MALPFKKSLRSLIFILLTLFIVAVGLGFWLQTKTQPHHAHNILSGITQLKQPVTLKTFQLTRDNGTPFENKNLLGHWSLLFFGFTHCPDICPTTLAKLSKAYQQLTQEKARPLPQVVFISVDPQRDSNTKIKAYLANFNTHFIGVSGSEKALAALAKQVGIVYMKAIKSGEKHHYNIAHSGAILVINPQGQWTAILSAPLNATHIAKHYLALTQRSTQG